MGRHLCYPFLSVRSLHSPCPREARTHRRVLNQAYLRCSMPGPITHLAVFPPLPNLLSLASWVDNGGKPFSASKASTNVSYRFTTEPSLSRQPACFLPSCTISFLVWRWCKVGNGTHLEPVSLWAPLHSCCSCWSVALFEGSTAGRLNALEN